MHYAEWEELHTSRLRLRKLTQADAPAYFSRLAGDEEVTKYMLFQPQRDISEAVASVQKAIDRYETGRYYRWAITLKDGGEFIGVIEPLRFDEEESSCSFAYMLGRDFWGKGYGTEALNVMLNFLFQKMGIERVEADHMAENTASGAVMRKAGMICCGVIPGKYEKNGRRHDAPQYVITREQWRNRQ